MIEARDFLTANLLDKVIKTAALVADPNSAPLLDCVAATRPTEGFKLAFAHLD